MISPKSSDGKSSSRIRVPTNSTEPALITLALTVCGPAVQYIGSKLSDAFLFTPKET